MLDVDSGDIDLGARRGQFRAPVRDVLVVPEKARNAPLVVFSHLRAPSCSGGEEGDVVAYPCPRGTKERRLDHGMTYLASTSRVADTRC